MKHIRTLCLILCVCLVIPTVLSACNTPGTSGNETGTIPGTAEADGTSDAATDEPGTDAPADVIFPDPAPVVKAYPDFAEYESVVVEEAPEPEVVRVEGEDYSDATLKGDKRSGKEWSGGKAYIVQYTPASMDDLWVEYTVTVEQGGAYDVSALITPSSQGWTCDYFISANGGDPETAVSSYVIGGTFECPTLGDNGVFRQMNLGKITLLPGENTVRVTIDPNDGRDVATLGAKVVLFLDWMEFSIGGGRTGGETFSVSYGAELLEGDDKDVLAGAANVSVFDCRYPIRFNVSANCDGKTEIPWSVKDFFGNTVYEGTLQNVKGKVTLTKCVIDHPTGYFTAKIGSTSIHYVVTPPLHTAAYADSPFAMDFAAYYLVKNTTSVYDLSCAARLMGVTWVRERCDWTTYEAKRGVYDFSSTDAVYDAIHRAGLKNLAMLCASPAWATTSYKASAQDTVSGMIGGFRDHQPDIYRMTRAMTEHYDGVVDAWELWNECDINGFAIEPAELYASWYKAASLGVMDADVKNKPLLSFGGLCQGPNTEYMSQLLQNDILKYSSIFNYHQHCVYNGSFMNFVYTLMLYMNASLPAYTDVDKPIWVTEAGMRLDLNGAALPTASQLVGQAPYIVTSTVQSLSYGTDRHYWFVMSPYIENGGDFGTFSPALDPYPTVAAEAVMTYMLGKARYIGVPSDLPSGCGGALFDTGSGMTSVLWSGNWTKKNTKYTFASEYPVIRTDLMGNQVVIEPEDGVVTVNIDRNPCYVTYKKAPAFDAQSFPDRAYSELNVPESGRVILTPLFDNVSLVNDKNSGVHIGGYTELSVRVLNLNDHEVTGSVIGSCPGLSVIGAENVTVPAMDEVIVSVILQTETDDNIDAFLTLTGLFGKDGGTSKSVSRVYTDKSVRTGLVVCKSIRTEGRSYDAGTLPDVVFNYSDVQGEVVVFVNGTVYDDFTVEKTADGGSVTISAEGLGTGRFFVSVGVLREGGEYVFGWTYFTVEADA